MVTELSTKNKQWKQRYKNAQQQVQTAIDSLNREEQYILLSVMAHAVLKEFVRRGEVV